MFKNGSPEFSDDSPQLRDDPGFVISCTYRTIRAALRSVIKEHDLNVTPEELSVLNRLHILGDSIRMGGLATCMERDPTTITRLLDGLVEKKLVERLPDPDDRRAILVKMTEAGRELHQSFGPHWESTIRQTLGGISEEDLAVTAKTLTAIQVNLGNGLA